ncbi:uncharacterized protein [Ranitomeya imitator]|uniref:uncharacterized protein isoform X2 n=1 Tax=Ranitomeya imitator TaxID=111125 RepID=UPI0037E7099B
MYNSMQGNAFMRRMPFRRAYSDRDWEPKEPKKKGLNRHQRPNTLYMELRGDPDKFFSYVRMKAENFDILVERVQHLIRSDTYCRFSITPAECLMVTLR